MKLTRKYVASHEAGHAVLAVHQRVAFIDVYIGDDLEVVGEGGALHLVPASFGMVWGCEDEVVRKMAGEAGARLAAGRKPGNLTFTNILGPMHGDYLSALDDIKSMGNRINGGCIYPSWLNEFIPEEPDSPYGNFRADDFCLHCYKKAYEILAEQRKFHSRVTAALVKNGRLTEVEVMELKDKRRTK
jgi:hypothetical protein